MKGEGYPTNYVRIAHLLTQYGIDDANRSISKAPPILYDEMKSLVEDMDSFKGSTFYRDYLSNRARLNHRSEGGDG